MGALVRGSDGEGGHAVIRLSSALVLSCLLVTLANDTIASRQGLSRRMVLIMK